MLENFTEELSLEPLIYFASHALLIIVIAAVVFFTLGLFVGYYTWAKFKRRSRAYFEELQIQRSEIAKLKRRILHQSPEDEVEMDAPTSPILMPGPLVAATQAQPPQPIRPTTVVLAAAVLKEVEEAPAPAEVLPLPTLSKVPEPQLSEASAAPVAEVPAQKSDDKTQPKSQQKPDLSTDHPAPAAETEVAPSIPTPEAQPEAEPLAPMNPSSLGLSRRLAKVPVQAVLPLAPAAVPMASAASTPQADVECALRTSHAAIDEKLGLVYHQRPERFDDLTLLRGLGEALQTKLSELGVYTFRQIALWRDEQVKEFDHRLVAKDRIRREQWVRQARNLHFLKYGEQLKPNQTPTAEPPREEAVLY